MKQYTASDLKTQVKNLEESAMMFTYSDGRSIPMRVVDAFREALGANYKGDENISFAEKMKRFNISEKLWNCDSGQVSLDTDEQKILKDLTGRFFHGEALGYLERIIEGKPLSKVPPIVNGVATHDINSTISQ